MDITYSLKLEGLTNSDGSDFYGRAAYDGRIYDSTYYRVSAIVTSLPEALKVVDALRAAVRARFPSWRETTKEVRLVASDWNGNPVRVLLDYVDQTSE